MTEHPALTIEGFSFRIGEKAILHNVSFVVKAGAFASLIGPNGAGKTTLIKCLNRIATGGTGRIEILGKPLDAYSQRELARLVSYVPQAESSRCPFSVFQFVLMGRYPYLSPFSTVGEEDRQVVWKALEETRTRDLAERRVATLSGGECQKVFIAAALAQEATILLLDEPTSFLDYKHRIEIMGLLKRLNRESGFTILSVTHDLSSAVLTGDLVVGLKAGVVAFAGAPAELTQGRVLENLYDTQFEFLTHPETGLPVVLPREDEP